MSEYMIIPKQDWKNICSAIRKKNKCETLYFSNEVSSAILDISDSIYPQITVMANEGSEITVTNGIDTLTQTVSSDGKAVFKVSGFGTWSITGNLDGRSGYEVVEVQESYTAHIIYDTIPQFTYSGNYEIVNDNDEVITESNENWKIRFLTSGTLVFTDLGSAIKGIDVFVVGGGGGSANGCGGGGGYTTTAFNIAVFKNMEYEITVGEGGYGSGDYGSGGRGEATTAFDCSAEGGHAATGGDTNQPGDGGSGGAGYSATTTLSGGTDGADGAVGTNGKYGKGQGSTTREFGEPNGKLYSTGGAGGTGGSNERSANTGDGGWYEYGDGGSGVVIIRNKRS